MSIKIVTKPRKYYIFLHAKKAMYCISKSTRIILVSLKVIHG